MLQSLSAEVDLCLFTSTTSRNCRNGLFLLSLVLPDQTGRIERQTNDKKVIFPPVIEVNRQNRTQVKRSPFMLVCNAFNKSICIHLMVDQRQFTHMNTIKRLTGHDCTAPWRRWLIRGVWKSHGSLVEYGLQSRRAMAH